MTSEPSTLQEPLIILLAAVAVVPLVRRFQASAVLGYLAAGALIGPHGFALVQRLDAIHVVGQFGVIFLLFAIGLSLSVERLLALRGYVFGLGVTQVSVTAIALWGSLQLIGVPSAAAVVLAGGLALSSTAVVLQVLTERRELATTRGRAVFAVLLLQDLAVVPLLTLVPLLKGPDAEVLGSLGIAVIKAAVALAVILAFGRLLLRPLFRAVTRAGDPELFTGIVLLLVLGVGWLTEQAGLSMALGAFLAGLLVAGTEYRPQVEGDIQPFRGVLLALFFMTVGMSIDLELLYRSVPLILALLVGLLVLKGCILFGLARGFHLSIGTATALSFTLAQGSEFGFVLFALAQEAGVLSLEIAQMAALVVGLSMAVTPLLLLAGRRVAQRLEGSLPDTAAMERDAGSPPQHVLIAGFGRVGQTLALLLESRGTRYVALDLDAEQVTDARRRDLPVYYGDASRADVLSAAGIAQAAAVVVTLDQPDSAGRTVLAIRRLAPDVPLLARARDLPQCEALTDAGASIVVPEVVEGSLQLAAALLKEVGATREEIDQALGEFRKRTYARLAPLTEATLSHE